MSTTKVRFEVHYVTRPGEEIRLAGSNGDFGIWNPKHSFPLKWTENHLWVVDTNLNQQDLEYKYVLVNGQQV